MRLKEVLEEKNVKAKDLAKIVGTDEPTMSKFINYRCLPIPKTMEKICKQLECTIEDIYKDNEVFYKKQKKSHKKDSNSGETLNCYKLTAVLPNEARKYLASDNLKALGYRSVTDWVWCCLRNLMLETKKTTSNCDSEIVDNKLTK